MGIIHQSGRLTSPCLPRTAHSWGISQVRQMYNALVNTVVFLFVQIKSSGHEKTKSSLPKSSIRSLDHALLLSARN